MVGAVAYMVLYAPGVDARISSTADISTAVSMRILNRNRSSFECFSLTNHLIDSGTLLANILAREGRANPEPTLFGLGVGRGHI